MDLASQQRPRRRECSAFRLQRGGGTGRVARGAQSLGEAHHADAWTEKITTAVPEVVECPRKSQFQGNPRALQQPVLEETDHSMSERDSLPEIQKLPNYIQQTSTDHHAFEQHVNQNLQISSEAQTAYFPIEFPPNQ